MATIFLTASFGQSQTGLETVGYTVKTAGGTVHAARSTESIVELGDGVYGAPIALPDQGYYVVLWDNGADKLRTAYSWVDTHAEGDASEVPLGLLDQLDAIRREVQGLKEKNIRKTPDDPHNPSRIDVSVKRDEASDWSPSNLVEQYSVEIQSNADGEVTKYGG